MDEFLLPFLCALILGQGARDQITLARLAAGIGAKASLLVVAIITCALTAAIMAWAGAEIAALMPPRARYMLIAIALAFGAAELFWPVRIPVAKEPTWSLGAIGAVLFIRQIGDAARFAIFAFAAYAHAPSLAWAGGALGAAAALVMGVTWRDELIDPARQSTLRAARIGGGVVMAAGAVWFALLGRAML